MNRIKELREEKNITQQELAQKINTTTKNIYRWENGLHDITGSNLIDLANVFGCSIDYLVGREGDDGLIRIQNEVGSVETNNKLTQFQIQLLSVLDQLTVYDQHQVLGFALGLAK